MNKEDLIRDLYSITNDIDYLTKIQISDEYKDRIKQLKKQQHLIETKLKNEFGG